MWALSLFIVFTFCFAQVQAKSVDHKAVALFEQFKLKFNKTYTTNQEHVKRFAVFSQNLAVVEELNKREGVFTTLFYLTLKETLSMESPSSWTCLAKNSEPSICFLLVPSRSKWYFNCFLTFYNTLRLEKCPMLTSEPKTFKPLNPSTGETNVSCKRVLPLNFLQTPLLQQKIKANADLVRTFFWPIF